MTADPGSRLDSGRLPVYLRLVNGDDRGPTVDAVRDETARRRYELDLEGALAFIDYRRDGRRVIMTHAEVPIALRGGGVGSALVKGALALVRERGEKVVPRCSFVAQYMQRHPETQDLLAGDAPEPALTPRITKTILPIDR